MTGPLTPRSPNKYLGAAEVGELFGVNADQVLGLAPLPDGVVIPQAEYQDHQGRPLWDAQFATFKSMAHKLSRMNEAEQIADAAIAKASRGAA